MLQYKISKLIINYNMYNDEIHAYNVNVNINL